VFLGTKRNLKGYKLWDSENKKIVLSRYALLNEALFFKSTVSQQVDRIKTKDVSQRMDVDAIPPSPVGSVLVGISPDVTPGGDHLFVLKAKQVE